MKINILDFFMATLQIAFIVLKICGVINWSWWVVLIPILFLQLSISLPVCSCGGQRATRSVDSKSCLEQPTLLKSV